MAHTLVVLGGNSLCHVTELLPCLGKVFLEEWGLLPSDLPCFVMVEIDSDTSM